MEGIRKEKRNWEAKQARIKAIRERMRLKAEQLIKAEVQKRLR